VPSTVKQRRAIRDKKLFLAAADVSGGKCSLREASMKYAVPKSTLYDRVSGKVAFGSISGPERYLNNSEEEQLVKFLIGAAKIGFPRSKKQVLSIVQATLARKRSCSVDEVQTVTPGWWNSFKKRHPLLTLRSGSKLSHRRALASSPETINSYFDILEETIQKNNLQNSPMFIYNCDETGFPLEHKPCKVIGVRGQRDLPSITSGDKTQITVLSACSASGNLLPPMIIFDRKRLKATHMVGEVPGTVYASSKKGWIDSEIFLDWFVNHFLLHIPPHRPILLLVDGHSSHYHPDVIRKATENHIILFCLPPHTTHLCQPLDRTCFSSLKSAYNQQCQQFLSNNPDQVISRLNFTQIFSRAWTQAMTPANIVMGFRATGVYPLNRYIVLQHVTKNLDSEYCEIDELASKMGLYVPLYSPAKNHRRLIDELQLDDEDIMSTSDDDDVDDDQEIPDEPVDSPPEADTEPSYIHEFLVLPSPPKSKNIYKAIVLTSDERMRLIEEKERDKAKKEEEKELRKLEREKKINEKKRQMELKSKNKGRRKSTTEPVFTNEEHKKFNKRHENGYDIPDDRYSEWLRVFYPDDPLIHTSTGLSSTSV
jgi:hypothetical protein